MLYILVHDLVRILVNVFWGVRFLVGGGHIQLDPEVTPGSNSGLAHGGDEGTMWNA